MTVVKAKARVVGQDSRTSSYVQNQIPQYVKEQGNGLYELLAAYYEWAEQEGNFLGDARRLLEYQSARSEGSKDRFIDFFKDEILPSWPGQTAVQKKNLLRFAKDFYKAKGSEESYKYLFKVLFNEDVQIEYPGDKILKTSDGTWERKTVMKIAQFDEQLGDLTGRTIYGITSGSNAVVDSIISYQQGDIELSELSLKQVSGPFLVDEVIETRDSLTRISSKPIGIIGQFNIISAGKGYKEDVIIPFSSQGDGVNATVKIAAVDSEGGILSISIIETGAGYVYAAPIMDLSSPSLFDPEFDVQQPAQIDLIIDSAISIQGEYRALRSALSDISRIQDGFFYQEFSYLLKTPVPLQDFKPAVVSLIHPAGTVLFSQPEFNIGTDNILHNPGSILFHLSRPDEVNYKNPNYTSSRNFFEPEIQRVTFKYNKDVVAEYETTYRFVEFESLQSVKQEKLYTVGNIQDFGPNTIQEAIDLYSTYKDFNIRHQRSYDFIFRLKTLYERSQAYRLAYRSTINTITIGNRNSTLAKSSFQTSDFRNTVYNTVEDVKVYQTTTVEDYSFSQISEVNSIYPSIFEFQQEAGRSDSYVSVSNPQGSFVV